MIDPLSENGLTQVTAVPTSLRKSVLVLLLAVAFAMGGAHAQGVVGAGNCEIGRMT